MSDTQQSKACSTCKQIKLFSEYPKHSGMANGINSRCRVCHRAASYAWRDANKQKVLESNRQYHHLNKEVRNAGRKQRYISNWEYYFQWRKEYYLKTSDRQKQSSRDWRKNNPEKFMMQQRKRRAKEKSVPSEPYSWQDIVNLHGDICWLCGQVIDLEAPRKPGEPGWENGLHLDHVIPILINGPDLKWNVQPTHGLCNLGRKKRP